MVRPIMRDPLFLAGKSEPATEAGAIYRIKRVVLVNTDIVDESLENFKEEQVGQGIKPTLYEALRDRTMLYGEP